MRLDLECPAGEARINRRWSTPFAAYEAVAGATSTRAQTSHLRLIDESATAPTTVGAMTDAAWMRPVTSKTDEPVEAMIDDVGRPCRWSFHGLRAASSDAISNACSRDLRSLRVGRDAHPALRTVAVWWVLVCREVWSAVLPATP